MRSARGASALISTPNVIQASLPSMYTGIASRADRLRLARSAGEGSRRVHQPPRIGILAPFHPTNTKPKPTRTRYEQDPRRSSSRKFPLRRNLRRQGKSGASTARHFAILTCMDARLDPAKYAGLSEGDAHVIRNAGGRASDDAIRSLVISHKLLGTQEWFVIHHTDCGMAFVHR